MCVGKRLAHKSQKMLISLKRATCVTNRLCVTILVIIFYLKDTLIKFDSSMVRLEQIDISHLQVTLTQ